MSYDFIYKMRPVCEIEPDWYKLAWKPIRFGTWNIYSSRPLRASAGLRAYLGGALNGWGRYWRRVDIILSLFFVEVNFWLIWDIRVHKDGPFDQELKRPLPVSDTTGLSRGVKMRNGRNNDVYEVCRVIDAKTIEVRCIKGNRGNK